VHLTNICRVNAIADHWFQTRDGTPDNLALARPLTKQSGGGCAGAPMQSSECRKYAEQCSRLAERLTGEQRDFLVEMASKWVEAATALEASECARSDQTIR
jgi:hypothetical protein